MALDHWRIRCVSGRRFGRLRRRQEERAVTQRRVGDNPYLAKKAQGQFVIVTLTVQNIGDKPQSFSPSNQKLLDASGRSFASDSMAQIALGGSDIPLWDNINPGNTVDVKLIYDMPAGAAPASVELHDSMLSGGVTVALTP